MQLPLLQVCSAPHVTPKHGSVAPALPIAPPTEPPAPEVEPPAETLPPLDTLPPLPLDAIEPPAPAV